MKDGSISEREIVSARERRMGFLSSYIKLVGNYVRREKRKSIFLFSLCDVNLVAIEIKWQLVRRIAWCQTYMVLNVPNEILLVLLLLLLVVVVVRLSEKSSSSFCSALEERRKRPIGFSEAPCTFCLRESALNEAA